MKLQIIVHPNSKHPRVEKNLLGNWHVYVSAPPLQGRANAAVIQALAEHFKTGKAQMRLLRGAKNKIKLYDIGEPA